MPVRKKFTKDRVAQQIKTILVEKYESHHPQARIDVKRYNSACVRVRIIDPDFQGQSLADRDDAVWDVVDKLPQEVVSEVSLLVLLTPKESKTSSLNIEFDHPTPSPF